ncbi:hypothetical protein D3C85_840140 [compost metagenome]
MLHREFGQQTLEVFERRVAPFELIELFVERGQFFTVQVPVGKPAIERVRRANLHTADAEIHPQFARNARQEIAAADVREVADADFGHCQSAFFGDHPQIGALHQAHTAAQYETVHQGEHRFAVVVDRQVESIFLDEEILV